MKVLICGDVRGRLGVLCARVKQLNESKNGPFDLLLCAGEFFAESPPAAPSPEQQQQEQQPQQADDDELAPFLQGSEAVPIPTYFITGLHVDESTLARLLDKQPNLRHLGQAGLQAVDGLRVAYLSGGFAESAYLGKESEPEPEGGSGSGSGAAPTAMAAEDGSARRVRTAYQRSDVQRVLAQASALEPGLQVDVLLTLEVPRGVADASQMDDMDPSGGSVAAAALCEQIAPRYHFCGSSRVFFQRAPFRAEQESGHVFVTRFHALAPVNPEASKERKWLHALNLAPQAAPLAPPGAAVPAGCTESPFRRKHVLSPAAPLRATFASSASSRSSAAGLTEEQVNKLMREDRETQFFFGNRDGSFRYLGGRGGRGGGRGRGGRGRGRGGRRGPPRIPPRMDCWFCLASPTCEQHLIVSVAEDTYVALPKGGIVPEHTLIVPIGHALSLTGLDAVALAEVVQYQRAIRAYYASRGYVAVFFERNVSLKKAAQRHAFLEALPVPATAATRIESILNSEAARAGISFEVLCEPDADPEEAGLVALQRAMGDEPDNEYMFVELPHGKSLLYRLSDANKYNATGKLIVPIQFGRIVACRLHGSMQLADWKKCVVPHAEEERLTNSVKKAFEAYDFTLEGEDEGAGEGEGEGEGNVEEGGGEGTKVATPPSTAVSE